MLVEEFFDLDCSAVIPECGYQCAKCIEEICSVLKGVHGVSEVSSGKRGEVSGIVVRRDSETITTDDLMEAFRKLPSFYRGSFVPRVLDA
jgi:hypothetical protein